MRLVPPTRPAIHIPQGVRFLFAGGFAALITWLVRFPLSDVMPFAAAVTVANAIGMVIGFISYRTLVFPGSTRPIARQIADFLLVNLFSMAVVVAVAIAFADYIMPALGFAWHTEAVAHAIGIAAGAVSNYFGHKTFSFARR